MNNLNLPPPNSYGNILPEGLDTLESWEASIAKEYEKLTREKLAKQYNVKQLPNGAWYTRINGKKRQFKNRDDLIDAIIKEINEQNQTLVNIFPEYLERRKLSVAKTTWAFDIKYFDTYIKESNLKDIPIAKITLDDGYKFFEYCKEIKPDMKRSYWNNIKSTLNNLFQFTIDERIISDNPFRNLKIAKDKLDNTKGKEEDTVFTDKEQLGVCEYAREYAIMTNRAEPLAILIFFNLALRVAELSALKWRDIENLNGRKYLHINREVLSDVDEKGNIKGTYVADHTKTPAGDRQLELIPETLEILEKVKQYNKQNNIPISDNDFIFMRWYNEELTLCTRRSFDKRLRIYCNRAGMKKEKSCHDIRRTTLTNLYRNGMPLKDIQYFAGHSTLQQTMEYLRIKATDNEKTAIHLSSISMKLDDEK